MTTFIQTPDGSGHVEIEQGFLKGCRPEPIGKTGYTRRKIVAPASKGVRGGAPTTYHLINPLGKVVGRYLDKVFLNQRARTLAAA